MPASVLIVHQEPDALGMLLQAVRRAGHDAVGFEDPLSALSAIEVDSRVRVLITRLDFGPGKLNGLALARMLRLRKCAITVVFVDRPEKADLIDGLGEFVPHPVDPLAITDAVVRLLGASATEPEKAA